MRLLRPPTKKKEQELLQKYGVSPAAGMQPGGVSDGVPRGFGALLCRLAGVSASAGLAAGTRSVPERLPCPPCVVAASAAARNGGSVLGSSIGSGSPAADPMHGIRCGPAPVLALSPRSSDLVGEMQSLAAAIQLNPVNPSPFPWVPPRDPLSEREQRLLPVGMVRVAVGMMMVVVLSERVVGGASDMSTVLSYCAAPVLCSRWVGSTGSATSSSGGDFDQLVGTRMYRECMGETGTGSPVRQPQPTSAEQQNRDSCSSKAAGGLVTSCQDTDTPSTPAAVLPRAA